MPFHWSPWMWIRPRAPRPRAASAAAGSSPSTAPGAGTGVALARIRAPLGRPAWRPVPGLRSREGGRALWRCWLDEAEWPPISGTGVPTVRPPASPRPEAPWPAFAAASPAPGGDVPLAVAPGGGDPPAPAGEEGSRRTGPGGGPPAAPAAGPSAAAPARSSGPLLGGPPHWSGGSSGGHREAPATPCCRCLHARGGLRHH